MKMMADSNDHDDNGLPQYSSYDWTWSEAQALWKWHSLAQC